MRINLFAEDMNNVIERVGHVMSKNSRLPVLETLRLTAENNTITLTANNLESEIHMIIDGNIQESGSILIDKDNFKLIKKLKGELEIYNNSDTITIKGNRELQYVSIPANEFPPDKIDPFNNEAFTIPANEFKEMLKIKIAAFQDDTKPILKSICIHDYLAWALDSYRCIQYMLNINNKCNKDIIIPLLAINQLDKILDKKDSQILTFTYEIEEKKMKLLKISGKDFVFITRLYNEDYMNVKSIIPTDFEQCITVNAKDLKESLEFAAEINNDKKANTPVIYNIEDNIMTISRNSAMKSMKEKLNIDMETEKSIRIAFNHNFWLDTLKTLDTDKIRIKLNKPTYGVVVTSIEDDKELHFILPVKLMA